MMVKRQQGVSAPPSSPEPSQGVSGGAGTGADGSSPQRSLGFVDKVRLIKETLGIRAEFPKEVLAEANEQMGLVSEGPLPRQADALISALGL